jgi:hypothetical protein
MNGDPICRHCDDICHDCDGTSECLDCEGYGCTLCEHSGECSCCDGGRLVDENGYRQ